MLVLRSVACKRLLAAACSVVVFPSLAMAGASFGSNTTAKWTFDPDTSGGTQLKTLTLAPPPTGSGMPVPSNYQVKQTFTSGSATSTASGSIGYVLNSTTATFTLAAGTGVTQSDPGNAAYKGDSLLRVDFDGWFNPTSPGFGPPATGYVSIAVGGVVGSGGHTQFNGKVDFLNGNTSATLRPTVNFSKDFTSVGNFAQTFTSSALLGSGTIPVGTPIRVKGFFEFRASNAEEPSSMAPLSIEVGGAPPTATFYGNGSQNWTDERTWTPPDGTIIDDPDRTLPTIPNGRGQRARIIGGEAGALVLNENVTLGALDLDSKDVSITAADRISLKLDTGGEAPATIHARTSAGDNTQTIAAPIVLANDLEVVTDGTYQGPGAPKPRAEVKLNGQISGEKSLTKRGRGFAALNANNGFTGGTRIEGGVLDANVAGSLGTGNVAAINGLLNYNAQHAADTRATITADDGGQINLGVVPAADEEFSIGAFGILSGNATELRAMNAVEGGNLRLTGGATIAHESFDQPTLLENNPQSLGTTPQYIFGIATDVPTNDQEHIISIGTTSGTPWKGFGSDRFDRQFGSDPLSTKEIIRVFGEAELRSLDETLVINGQIEAAGEGAALTKTGLGAVSLNGQNNSFRAPITVKQGLLMVNGTLLGGESLHVTVDDGAILGGRGLIDGFVEAKDLATIAPGDNTLRGHVGTLTMKGLKLSPRSEMVFELDDPDVIGQGANDLIVVDGDLTLNGVLTILDVGDFGPGEYTLIQYSGDIDGDGLELNLATLPDYFDYKLGIQQSLLNGFALNGEVAPYNFLTLSVTPVPEPTGALLGIGLMGLASTRAARRRRRAN